MKYNVRPYRNSDFKEVCSWHVAQSGLPTLEGLTPEDGTFILELNNQAAAAITVFKTQSKELAYLEGLVKNPEYKHIEEYVQLLVNHAYSYAKDSGYKRLVCYCAVPALQEKYKRMGMTETMQNLNSFVREL